MKVGILTFHRAHNYGAVLQAFALQEVLKSFGCDVDIIDYRQFFIEMIHRCFSIRLALKRSPISTFYNVVEQVQLFNDRYARKCIFDNFTSSRLRIGKKICRTGAEIPDHYDLYVHGSDQIWNDKLTYKFDEVLFGNYNIRSGKRISYAASFENEPLSDAAKFYYETSLKNFDAISVRETELVEKLKDCTQKKIHAHIDPTLLVDKSIWDGIAEVPNESGYVLVHRVTPSPLVTQAAKAISKQMNCPIIDLQDLPKHPTVEQFVGFFKNASFVVASSFHAAVFSIVFKKPFGVVGTGTGRDVRYESLFNNLKIGNRFITNQNCELGIVNYGLVEKELDSLKREGTAFLEYWSK